MKKVISMLLLLALALTFVACSGDNDAENTTTVGTTKATTTTRDPNNDDDKPNPEDPGDDNEKLDTNVYLAYGSAAIDGVKEEKWNDTEGVEIATVIKGTPDADTVAMAYAMWDENGLYFLFDIKAHDFTQQAAVGDFNNASIYLFISETLNFTGNDNVTPYTNGDYQFALINEELSMIPRRGENDLSAEDGDYEVAYNMDKEGGSFVIEFRYKPKHMEMAAGKQLLLDYMYNDVQNNVRIGATRWYCSINGDFATINFGVGELLAQGAAIPEHA